jgi:predicted metal-dependent enzyme (double-stranded beta helix superfamily)
MSTQMGTQMGTQISLQATGLAQHDAIVAERMRLARAMLARVRAIAADGMDRDKLALVTQEMKALAARRELFPVDEFVPIEGGNASMYRLSEDADHRYALYVVAPAPGGFAPPHDHNTWAVIVGMHGREHNKLYRRTDDGSEPGVATLEQNGELDIVAGTSIALLPDEILSIHLGEDGPHANLHLYGMSVEHCEGRRMFSRSKNTCKVFPPATGVVMARGAD